MDISWYHFTAGHVLQNMEAVDWKKLYLHLPLLTMDEAIGRPNPLWKEEVEHSKLDSWWEPQRYQNKYEQVRVPVLGISGWYDDEQVGTPLNFIGMTTRGADQKLRRSQKMLMGPWPHAVNSTAKLGEVDFGPTAVIDMNAYWLRWFDYWLKGIDNGLMKEPPVRIFVMGENAWTNENEWPIARTRWTKYYLHSNGHANTLSGDGTLSTAEPANEPDGQLHLRPGAACSVHYRPKFRADRRPGRLPPGRAARRCARLYQRAARGGRGSVRADPRSAFRGFFCARYGFHGEAHRCLAQRICATAD